MINLIKCAFGFHQYGGHFQLHDYVNSGLADKKFRFSSWIECTICGKVPRTAPPVKPWDLLTDAEKEQKIALIQKRENTAPERSR